MQGLVDGEQMGQEVAGGRVLQIVDPAHLGRNIRGVFYGKGRVVEGRVGGRRDPGGSSEVAEMNRAAGSSARP